MAYHQHRFDDVTSYLHHRDPYLMVDEVVSIQPQGIVTHKKITGQEYFIAGHFPGASIVPGAMLQELTTQSAGILIAAEYNPMKDYDTSDPFHNEYALGVLARVNHAKFKGFARPGDQLTATVTLDDHLDSVFRFSASVQLAGTTIMQNRFQLVNILSVVLQGKQPV